MHQRPELRPDGRNEALDGAAADPAVVAEAWDTWRGEVAFAEQFAAAQEDLGSTVSFDNGLGEQGHPAMPRDNIPARIGTFCYATAPPNTRLCKLSQRCLASSKVAHNGGIVCTPGRGVSHISL
jgi:hypothetical protein